MPAQNEWFIEERSKALASLLLTDREGVVIRSEEPRAGGVDLLVELNEGNKGPSTMLFVVQVRGTLIADKSEWMEDVKQLFRTGTNFYLPACVIVVNVRDNQAEYAWLAQPYIEPGKTRLDFFEQGVFLPLDSHAVDQIIDQVAAWYHAAPWRTANLAG